MIFNFLSEVFPTQYIILFMNMQGPLSDLGVTMPKCDTTSLANYSDDVEKDMMSLVDKIC